jgi:hypothetical protein
MAKLGSWHNSFDGSNYPVTILSAAVGNQSNFGQNDRQKIPEYWFWMPPKISG